MINLQSFLIQYNELTKFSFPGNRATELHVYLVSPSSNCSKNFPKPRLTLEVPFSAELQAKRPNFRGLISKASLRGSR